MKNKGICFPYPVLGIGDDLDSNPSITSRSIEEEKDYFVIHIDLDVDNEDIQNLIDKESAEYACEIDCPTTFYRRVLKSKTPAFDVRINRKDVAERVYFDCTVTAIKPINSYSNKAFNEDYKGFVFNLGPGDLLAFIGKLHYDADVNYEKLKSAGSFVTIIKGHDENNTIYYLANPKIEIQLPPSLYEDYRINFNNPGNHANIFHSSMVLNALVYALLNYDEGDHSDLLWARTLKDRIELEPGLSQYSGVFEKEKDPMLVLKFAQALLSNPYKRLLETMHDLIHQPTQQEGY